MKKDLISVIIPVYNVEKYLHRCLDSVINQTYKNLEIILVDDGSTDSSGDICDEYAKKDKRIKVIHKKNGGLSDARNVGIDECSGKYITFIDSDDYIDIDYVEYLLNMLLKNKADVSICDCNLVYENKGFKQLKTNEKIRVLSSKETITEMLYTGPYYISAWGKLYKTSFFRNINYPVGKLYEDIGTTYKVILQANTIVCSNVPKYNYYLRSNSITTSKPRKQDSDMIELTDKMCEEINKVYPDLNDAIIRRKTFARISIYKKYVYDKSFSQETKKLKKEILKNKKFVMNLKRTPLRDKVALILISLGTPFFKISWRIYSKLR